jgi:hypothetical protein
VCQDHPSIKAHHWLDDYRPWWRFAARITLIIHRHRNSIGGEKDPGASRGRMHKEPERSAQNGKLQPYRSRQR